MGDADKDIGELMGRVKALESWTRDIDGKVDQLLAIANMGRGAWFLALKFGGATVAILAAIAWIIEHLGKALR